MKIKRRDATLKLTAHMDEPSSWEFWVMCIELYEKMGYVNDVNITIKGGNGGPIKLQSRPLKD